MSLTINTKTYSNEPDRGPDSTRYSGPSHTLTASDYADLHRTHPKKTASSLGKGKASFKITRSMTDGTVQLEMPGIITATSSLPVGFADAEADALIDDFVSWLGTVEAKALFKNLDVTH